MDLSHVRRGVEEGRLHQSVDVALHLAASTSLQIFLDGVAGQKIRRLGFAIAAAGADIGASTLHLDLQAVATSVGCDRGLVAQQVILVLILGDPLQPAKKIVGVEDDKSAGAVGELVEHLLVVRSAGRKWRNNLPGLRVKTLLAIGRGRPTGPAAARLATLQAW